MNERTNQPTKRELKKRNDAIVPPTVRERNRERKKERKKGIKKEKAHSEPTAGADRRLADGQAVRRWEKGVVGR